jgi:hypothetical protein
MALRKAFEPSVTHKTPCVVSSPRSMRSASSAVATVEFSVEPSQSPSGILTPCEVIPSATMFVRPFKSMPPEHQHRQADVVQTPSHQLAQSMSGALDECA